MRRFIALFIGGVVALLFLILTGWQLRRYGQNSSLVREKQNLSKLVPEMVTALNAADFPRLRFRRITMVAEIHRTAWVLLPGKSSGGESGRHFYLFARPEKSDYYIPVLAGFAGTKVNSEAYWKNLPAKMQITGSMAEMYPTRDASLLRAGNPNEFMVPEMHADALGKMTGLKIFPGVLEAEAPLSTELEKVAARVVIKPEMNLVYALQWLALAALTLWWLKTQWRPKAGRN